MKKDRKTKGYKKTHPLLIKGRDWRKRIPPKGAKTMADKIYMTRDEWMDYYAYGRKKWGNNILDWPKHQRDRVRKIEIVKVAKVELKQASIPYGNTGVTSRGGAD